MQFLAQLEGTGRRVVEQEDRAVGRQAELCLEFLVQAKGKGI
jgi:hypothetical protein